MVKGEPFSREIVRRDVMTLREAYADEGYAYAEVVPADPGRRQGRTPWTSPTGPPRATRSGSSGSRSPETPSRETTSSAGILSVYEGEYFSGYGMRKKHCEPAPPRVFRRRGSPDQERQRR
ncbi:MAG: hypothetical protein MZV70_45730 [Desulfobacterales bacterium]|nr:hypothetical protein [Desulfobacterales bacterium]